MLTDNHLTKNERSPVLQLRNISQIAHLRLTTIYSLLSAVDKRGSVKEIKHSRILFRFSTPFHSWKLLIQLSFSLWTRIAGYAAHVWLSLTLTPWHMDNARYLGIQRLIPSCATPQKSPPFLASKFIWMIFKVRGWKKQFKERK